MTRDRMNEVVEFYARDLDERVVEDPDMTDFEHTHVRYHMIPTMKKMLATFNAEEELKLNRWLGFIQGWLWAKSYFSIEEMRDHNREEKDGGARLQV